MLDFAILLSAFDLQMCFKVHLLTNRAALSINLPMSVVVSLIDTLKFFLQEHLLQ